MSATKPYVHEYSPPESNDHEPKQRYFKNHHFLKNTQVRRFQHEDTANVSIWIRHCGGTSTTCSYLSPAQLRELAAQLLDAAHDIETHPAASFETNDEEA